MPKIATSFKNGYNYGDNIKKQSKKLEEIIKKNFLQKDMQAKKEEKHLEGGIKLSLKKFDKKIKDF